MKPRLIRQHGWILPLLYLLIAADVARPSGGEATALGISAGVAGMVLLAVALCLKSDWYEVVMISGIAVIGVPFLIDTWLPREVAFATGTALVLFAGYVALKIIRTEPAANPQSSPGP